MGETSHQTTISPIIARSSVPVARPRPAMAPTAVIEVEAGTPATFERKSAKPMKNSTPMLTTSVNSDRGISRPPRVSTTFRPTVHPPIRAKTLIRPAARSFETTPLPTAGPKATPVEEPPMLNPTNTATAIPITRSSSTT